MPTEIFPFASLGRINFLMINKPNGPRIPSLHQVLFEFQRIGNVMRVVAIDPVTMIEVTMVADPRQSQDTIKKVAARKLAYVIAKKRDKEQSSR